MTTELDGKWKVVIEDDFWSFFNIFGDHKIIKNGQGHNSIGGVSFGYFSISELDGQFILNYNSPRNPAELRTISDIVKRTESKDKFNGQLFRNEKFGFNFSLLRS